MVRAILGAALTAIILAGCGTQAAYPTTPARSASSDTKKTNASADQYDPGS